MTGRPPSTVEGQVKQLARRLRGPGGVMGTLDRLHVMKSLMAQADGQARYADGPDPSLLCRLAAHAIVWAEELDGAGDGDA
jgi:hypothetical protein